MIKINKGEVELGIMDRPNVIISEILCGVMAIKGHLLRNNKSMINFFDKELQRIIDCKSLDDLKELADDDE